MVLHRIPPRRTRVLRALAIASRLMAGGTALVLLGLVACGDSSGPDGGGESATLTGTVRAAVGSAVLAGAQITIGQRQATSDTSGHFEVTGLRAGAVTVQARRAGYLAATTALTLSAGDNTHDFALAAQEIFVSGPNAMFLPAGSGPIRGVIIILGGPITSGFVTGGQIAPLDKPALEQSLQSLGQNLRSLATSWRVALLGTSTIAMANSAVSDNTLFTAMSSVAGLSGHPEMALAPVLLVGFSAGAPEAAGLVSRNPDRAIGLVERVPTAVTNLTAPAALAVPTFVMQAELDAVVNNQAVQVTFAANRSRGGLWALAVEPGISHDVATGLGNATLSGWITLALARRLGPAPGDPLIVLDQLSGWLGDQTTLEIAPWATYPGDPSTASWLLSQTAATSWQALGTVAGP